MSQLTLTFKRRWDDRIISAIWSFNDKVICFANRRTDGEEQYDFFGGPLTVDSPRVWRFDLNLDQCTLEAEEHFNTYHPLSKQLVI